MHAGGQSDLAAAVAEAANLPSAMAPSIAVAAPWSRASPTPFAFLAGHNQSDIDPEQSPPATPVTAVLQSPVIHSPFDMAPPPAVAFVSVGSDVGPAAEPLQPPDPSMAAAGTAADGVSAAAGDPDPGGSLGVRTPQLGFATEPPAPAGPPQPGTAAAAGGGNGSGGAGMPRRGTSMQTIPESWSREALKQSSLGSSGRAASIGEDVLPAVPEESSRLSRFNSAQSRSLPSSALQLFARAFILSFKLKFELKVCVSSVGLWKAVRYQS